MQDHVPRSLRDNLALKNHQLLKTSRRDAPKLSLSQPLTRRLIIIGAVERRQKELPVTAQLSKWQGARFNRIIAVSSDAYVPKMHFGRPKGGMLKPPSLDHLSEEERLLVNSRVPSIGWFDQKLDHFNPADVRRWKQRYFSANKQATGKGLFILIGGEGPTDLQWVVASAIVDYAKKFDAVILQLEHRYYGDSHPTPNTTVANLQYLSSEQALADLAAFISAMKAELKAEKVIVFGGSYAGNLAAWFRLKYPHLADGAVSSSAPVLAQVDYVGYLEAVQKSLDYFYPKGDCSKALADATAEMLDALKTEDGRKKLKKLFNICEYFDTKNKKDLETFFVTMADPVTSTVQYNPSYRNSGFGIDSICKPMINSSTGTPLERYAKLQPPTPMCGNYSYKDMVEFYKDVTPGSTFGGREWIYQTCTEFGQYQSTDSPKQPFGQTMPLSWYVQQCVDIFGSEFNTSFIQRAVKQTNIEYGARNYRENRIIFINGGIDPWHSLGITHSLPNAPSILIPSTSHCANMYVEQSSDPPALKAARAKIVQLLGQWLK